LPTEPPGLSETPGDHVRADCLFLSLILLFSFAFYIPGLGFYSDDWAVFATFQTSEDQSFVGLFQSFYTPEVWKRPVQILYYAFLYSTFGLQPSGHHIFNNVLFLTGVLFFYVALRQLRINRTFALSIAVIFSLLPHYSTNRLWFMSFQVNLCMTLYFISLYLDLKASQLVGRAFWIWKTGAIITMTASILAYELFIPLFFLNIFLIWRQSASSAKQSWKHVLRIIGVNIGAIACSLIFKAFALGHTRILIQKPLEHVLWFMNLLFDSARISFGTYGLEMPILIARVIQSYTDWKLLTGTAVILIAIFLYLYRTLNIKQAFERHSRIKSMILWGLFVFGLGHAIFLISENAVATPTGINNRMAAAAAIGFAIFLVGAIAYLNRFLSGSVNKIFYCVLISFFCSSGFLINCVISKFWVTAYSQERIILADLRKTFPVLSSETTLIVDGICAYDGPAVVFESGWDLAGALAVSYRKAGLKADVVSSQMAVKEKGLSKILYGEEYLYGYSKNLLIYHFGQKQIFVLQNEQSAHAYFDQFSAKFRPECPIGWEGGGAPIF
jgi:hypothetical protein